MTKIFDYEKREILAKNSHKTVSKLICAYLRTKLNLNPVQSSPAQLIFITTLIVEYFIFIKNQVMQQQQQQQQTVHNN